MQCDVIKQKFIANGYSSNKNSEKKSDSFVGVWQLENQREKNSDAMIYFEKKNKMRKKDRQHKSLV